MKHPLIPPDEAERLAALEAYQVLDTLPEESFDDLTRIAASICDMPIALISLVDADRQWFKSRFGLTTAETPRAVSFCGHVVADGRLLVVEDATLDQRFADNPLVTDGPVVRFYAGAPLLTPTNHVLGTLCVIDHEPRQLSAERLDTLAALARQVVSQLELRLSLRRLAEERERLAQASQVKSQFLARMSHELRTPLNAILGYSDLVVECLRDVPVRPEVPEYLDLVLSAGEQLLGLVDGVLDLRKVEAGRLELAVQDIDLVVLAEAVAATVRPLMDRSGSRLQLDVEAGDGPVRGDPLKIQQCLLNLLANAARFTQAGLVRLEVRADEHEIVFAVDDDGIGLGPEQLERIFLPFEQATAQTAARFGGTGLGLAITRRLAELMGGEVTASGELGEGSCFVLRLPRVLEPPPA